MRKQRSPCTLPSYQNLPEWQAPTPENYDNETQWPPWSSPPWSQLGTVDSQLESPNPVFYDSFEFDQSAVSDDVSENTYIHSFDGEQSTTAGEMYSVNDTWNPAEPFPPGQYYGDPYDSQAENDFQYTQEDQAHPPFLQCGVPTVTDYGAVTILLRHLIRVDLTCNGSVSVYNFPSLSVTTLNATGNKCYVKHPNGRVFQEGPVVHMVTGNNRFVKISRKGVIFSPSTQGLAYFVDESGTKTTTAKFMDLSRDMVMDVFYDGNRRSYDQLEEESYRMAMQATYQNCADGGELWVIGRIRIKQDKWGEVTVSQHNGRRTIMASPTIRRATVESASININVDCYSKNYFTVRKDACSVTSGFCGLIVQNKSQKAGLDRNGRLVLF